MTTKIMSVAYIIWSCFLLHKFKMMISPDAFYISSKFWFSGSLGRVVCVCVCVGGRGGRKSKKWPKMTKNSVSLRISGTVPHMIVAKWWYLQQFFVHFFKILIFRIFQGSSIDAKRKFWGVPHVLHMCVIFNK